MRDLRTTIDQMGREVHFLFPPKRIVSLVPSQTEFLVDIGAPVMGRTRFCIHPEDHVTDIPIIGGTKKFRLEQIRELAPDLIVGNKEENYREGIGALENQFPVWLSDIYTLSDAFDMMSALGSICGLKQAASEIVGECREAMEMVKNSKSGTVVYLIWSNPWMAAGKHTFIDHLLSHLGYENLITAERYPQLTSKEIQRLDPDLILFSSEPFPFKEKHLREARRVWVDATCRLVDGALYSWYGSRLKGWATS